MVNRQERQDLLSLDAAFHQSVASATNAMEGDVMEVFLRIITTVVLGMFFGCQSNDSKPSNSPVLATPSDQGTLGGVAAMPWPVRTRRTSL